ETSGRGRMDRHHRAEHALDLHHTLGYLLINVNRRYGTRWRTCSGSSPSHSGLPAVPSKIDVVLNGSNFPVAAAAADLASNGSSSASLIGRNVRTASKA